MFSNQEKGSQTIRLDEIEGDIAFSTKSVEEIGQIQILGERVITIENLTTFHDYSNQQDFCIYLVGFHNQLKQKVIIRLHQQNLDKKYIHFGDIDAGGFYIYQHLIHKTGIPFQPMFMDVETLQAHKNTWKELTVNDRVRLKKIIGNEKLKIFHQTISFMLAHNCKLEQEAI